MIQEERDFPEIPGELIPEHISRELQIQISKLLGKRHNGFVGSQPVSFTESHIHSNLMHKDYFVCEKSDGLRCLLFCLLDPNQEEAVFLVTRENQFYRVPDVHFPTPEDENSCHNGTLIDGELVISKRPTDGVKELRYLMFDCLAVNGKDLTQRKLQSRLGYLGEHFYKPYFKLRENHPRETEHFPFKLSMKNMHESYKLPKVFASLKHLGHISDGLIFTCCETPYIFGTDPTLLKWKPSEENTIDFRFHLDIPIFVDEDLDERDPDRSYPNYDVKPSFELHIWQGGDKYAFFAKISISDDEWEKLKELNEPLEERIVECNRDENGNWGLLRFRDDKLNGNHATVVKKVLQSINDAVSKEDLIAASSEIENAWKQREFERKNPGHAQLPPSKVETRKRHTEEPMPTYDDEDNSDDDDDAVNEHKKPRTQ